MAYHAVDRYKLRVDLVAARALDLRGRVRLSLRSPKALVLHLEEIFEVLGCGDQVGDILEISFDGKQEALSK